MIQAYRNRLTAVLENPQLPKPVGVFLQFALLFILVGCGAAFMSSLVLGLLKLVGNISDFGQLNIAFNPAHFLAFLLSQSAIMAFGAFLLPAIAFFWLQRKSTWLTTGLANAVSLSELHLSLAIMFFTALFIPLLIQLNTAIPLPGFLAKLREGQQSADAFLEALFARATLVRYLLLVVFVALLPAIAEEVFFRGTLLNVLKSSVSPTTAIVLSAFCFSLFHGEFNNFLAIWWMGIILGYIYMLTKSLWASIAAHFLNNFVTISAKMAVTKGWIASEHSEKLATSIYICIPAGILMCVGLWLLARKTAYYQNNHTL